MSEHDNIEPGKPRQLSRAESHDLGMIIKDRTKVLRAHAEEQAAVLLADFEKHMAAIHSYDDDAVWQAATERAMAVVKEAQAEIEARCAELGIPKALAPQLGATWNGRGQMALEERRRELRRVAKTQIDAMVKAAVTKIEKQSLELRTQVVAMGLLSDSARLFLESLAPVEQAMQALDFGEIERRLDGEKQARRVSHQRLYGGGLE